MLKYASSHCATSRREYFKILEQRKKHGKMVSIIHCNHGTLVKERHHNRRKRFAPRFSLIADICNFVRTAQFRKRSIVEKFLSEMGLHFVEKLLFYN